MKKITPMRIGMRSNISRKSYSKGWLDAVKLRKLSLSASGCDSTSPFTPSSQGGLVCFDDRQGYTPLSVMGSADNKTWVAARIDADNTGVFQNYGFLTLFYYGIYLPEASPGDSPPDFNTSTGFGDDGVMNFCQYEVYLDTAQVLYLCNVDITAGCLGNLQQGPLTVYPELSCDNISYVNFGVLGVGGSSSASACASIIIRSTTDMDLVGQAYYQGLSGF